MKSIDAVKMFMMGIVVALLAMIAFRSTPEAKAGGTAVGTLMALTEVTNNGRTALLFLVDTQNKYMAMYGYDDSTFQFRAARYYKYDLGIGHLNQRGGIDVPTAKAYFEANIEATQELEQGNPSGKAPKPKAFWK